ncbi:MAG: N-acetyl-alpha-D-glucosaminyl L-malate synthase BshA, partial [Gillisia sp.]|nr:N-acetyl-alpha-D-glucosaminyl L-malate synthase BshA [Gillisia sp.]
HYAIPHAFAGYMAKKMLEEEGIFIPMVTTLHGTDITLVGNHPFYKPAVTFSINNSDVVTSVSESLKEDTLSSFKITKEIHVVPNFIDISKYQKKYTDCERSVLAHPDEKIISHVSNFRPVKRIDDVIRIFDIIQKKVKSKLIMVGDGPEKEMAENLVMELGIEDKVVFLGQSNEVDKILRFSDLFLLPSEKESFGLAALEAMANGVPVISSNSGGIPELNIHGVSGYLGDLGNVEEMAGYGISILESEETLERFKMNAYNRAKIFDIAKVVPLYEALYEKALSVKIKS